jgi:hypothetical protein
MRVSVTWAGVLLAVAWLSAAARPGAAQPPALKSRVVAELFTSEGCSSCPAADNVLSQLSHAQPVPGVEVIALGEHVDYWDHQGWRDPFSSALFSARQSEYDARVFHSKGAYTPQLVIDGRVEHVGSDITAVHRAIKLAAQAPKAALDVVVEHAADREFRVDLRVDVPPSLAIREADVMVAVTEDNLSTTVRRGENSGRTLRHSAVVRSLTTIGTLPSKERTRLVRASIHVAPEWRLENLRVVGLVQERSTRRIIGVGSAGPKP